MYTVKLLLPRTEVKQNIVEKPLAVGRAGLARAPHLLLATLLLARADQLLLATLPGLALH